MIQRNKSQERKIKQEGGMSRGRELCSRGWSIMETPLGPDVHPTQLTV